MIAKFNTFPVNVPLTEKPGSKISKMCEKASAEECDLSKSAV